MHTDYKRVYNVFLMNKINHVFILIQPSFYKMYDISIIYSVPIAGRVQAVELLSFLHRKKAEEEGGTFHLSFSKTVCIFAEEDFSSCNTLNQKDMFSVSVKRERKKKKRSRG